MNINDFNLLLPGLFSEFENMRECLANFLIRLFGNSDEISRVEKIFNPDIVTLSEEERQSIYKDIKDKNIALEDIFTFLDKAIAIPEFLQVFNDKDLLEIHKCLDSCLTYLILVYTAKAYANEFYYKFSKYIYDIHIKKSASITLISLNWDTLIDYFIHKCCIENNSGIDIDYGCTCSYIDGRSSLNNIANIKLLKPHGSVNWLKCSNCGRLFIDFSNKLTVYSMTRDITIPELCPYCAQFKRAFSLDPLIITPTYLKVLDNVHLKSIWHNMFLEISQADEVVFIGYSLPHADFELKYLLKRAICSNTTIKVILSAQDNPKKYKNKNMDVPEYRYKSLFASNSISFNYSGFINAFSNGYI